MFNMEFSIADKKKKDVFVSIFSLLKSSSSQINMVLTENNLHIQGMDKSHICLFDLNLMSGWFETYNVTKTHMLCFDTSIFYSMISIKSDEQSLYLSLETDNSDSMSIKLINEEAPDSKKKEFNKYFTIPLIDYEYEEMGIPDTEYDAEFSLKSKEVSDMLSQLGNFGDDVNVECSEDCVDFKTSKNSVDMRVNVKVDDMISYAVVEDEKVNLTYSLIYINKLCITNKLTSEIEFSMSNEYPMKINYNLGKDSSLVFYIAPKVSD